MVEQTLTNNRPPQLNSANEALRVSNSKWFPQKFLKLKARLKPKIAVLCIGTNIWLARYFIFHCFSPNVSLGERVKHVSLIRDLPYVNLSLLAAGVGFPLLAWSEITLAWVSRCLPSDTVCFGIIVMFV
jgi:hypothetical protein